MDLRSTTGDSLRLEIVGYQFPELQTEEYDSNWLRIRLSATNSRGAWTALDPMLLTYEVAALGDWFDNVEAGGRQWAELGFIEPNLSFCVSDQGIRVYFELEARPPWAPSRTAFARDVWLDFPLESTMLQEAAASLREQLRRYPQRAAV